jgi:hypothetical protein
MIVARLRMLASRVPLALMWVACLQVERGLRADLGAEWRAELQSIPGDADDSSITGLVRATLFAAGLALRARRITREFTGSGPDWPLRVRLVMGVGLLAGSAYAAITDVSALAHHQTSALSFAANAVLALACMANGLLVAAGMTIDSYWIRALWINATITAATAVLCGQQKDVLTLVCSCLSAISLCLLATLWWRRRRSRSAPPAS